MILDYPGVYDQTVVGIAGHYSSVRDVLFNLQCYFLCSIKIGYHSSTVIYFIMCIKSLLVMVYGDIDLGQHWLR